MFALYPGVIALHPLLKVPYSNIKNYQMTINM